MYYILATDHRGTVADVAQCESEDIAIFIAKLLVRFDFNVSDSFAKFANQGKPVPVSIAVYAGENMDQIWPIECEV